MKVLFIYPNIASSKGVLKKVVSKLNLLHALEGIDCEVLIYGERIEQDAYIDINPNVQVLEIEPFKGSRLLRRKPLWPILYERQMHSIYDRILRKLTDYEVDIVVLREFPMSKAGVKFLKRVSKTTKVLFEINTVIESEHEMKTKDPTLGEWYRVELEKERKFKPLALNYLSGIIPVTNELDQYIQYLSTRNIPSTVFSNGVSLASDRILPFPNPEVIRGIFLAGTASQWNGLDRLKESIRGYRGTQKLHVHVFGGESFDPIENGGARLEHHEAVDQSRLPEILAAYHFGISTLALHRKKMNEASTLKVRDYLINGLPVLLAYHDTDLNKEDSFVFKVSNDNSIIDFEAVTAWLKSNIERRTDWKQEIREVAEARLSYKTKISRLSEFLFKINHGSAR